MSDEELKQMMGDAFVYCVISDIGFIDATGIFIYKLATNVLRITSQIY